MAEERRETLLVVKIEYNAKDTTDKDLARQIATKLAIQPEYREVNDFVRLCDVKIYNLNRLN